jgi:hypothetical protein
MICSRLVTVNKSYNLTRRAVTQVLLSLVDRVKILHSLLVALLIPLLLLLQKYMWLTLVTQDQS